MEGCVRLYDLRESTSTMTLIGHGLAALCAKWSPKNEYELWTSGTDGSIIQWDIRSPKPKRIHAYSRRTGVMEEAAETHRMVREKAVSYFEFSLDYKTAYTVDEDGFIKSWNLSSGNGSSPLSLSDTGVVFPRYRFHRLHAEQGILLDRFSVSTDNTRLYAPFKSHIGVIDTSSGREIASLANSLYPIIGCQFNHCTNVCYPFLLVSL